MRCGRSKTNFRGSALVANALAGVYLRSVPAVLEPPSTERTAHASLPLCVDLDGTLLRTDTLIECLLLFFLHCGPSAWVSAGRALWRGKASFKAEVTRRTGHLLEVGSLPYSGELLAFLREQKKAGRRLVLVTAADRAIAERIAADLQLFDEVLASEHGVNLAGPRKAARLRERFGRGGFSYAGNARVDRQVWSEAGEVILVNSSAALRRQVAREQPIGASFARPAVSALTLAHAMRLHQWLKNLLIFVPFLAAHHWREVAGWMATLLAFGAFSLGASAVYLVNDLFDLQADRRHRRKSGRPFASGALPLTTGFLLIAALIASSLGAALLVSPEFFLTLGFYFLLALAYAGWLRRVAFADVMALAALYAVRLVAGAAAAEVVLSSWLLAFSLLFFLSLALAKRFAEFHGLQQQNLQTSLGRGYSVRDLGVIARTGMAAGCGSVLILALYIRSGQILQLYGRPWLLWALCPILFYWLSRLWRRARAGELHEDPVVFALRDAQSYRLGAMALMIVLLAHPR